MSAYAGQPLKRYMWAYQLSDRRAWAPFVKMARSLAITDVFLSMSREPPLAPLHLDDGFLVALMEHIRPIRVHVMLFQMRGATIDEGTARSVLAGLDGFCRRHPSAPLAGVHLDLEPHASAEFLPDAVDDLFGKYMTSLGIVRNALDECDALRSGGCLYSAATGWWYEFRDDVGVGQLGKILDAIVPMGYNTPEEPVGGTAERYLARMPFQEWEGRAPESCVVIPGLGVREYRLPLTEVLNEVSAHIVARPRGIYGGIAIYNDHAALDLDRPPHS